MILQQHPIPGRKGLPPKHQVALHQAFAAPEFETHAARGIAE